MKRIYVRNEDGMEVEITEGVQAMYDIVIGSMDWGSKFLTVEDALPIAALAKACDFKEWEEAERYVATMREYEERKKNEHMARTSK